MIDEAIEEYQIDFDFFLPIVIQYNDLKPLIIFFP